MKIRLRMVEIEDVEVEHKDCPNFSCFFPSLGNGPLFCTNKYRRETNGNCFLHATSRGEPSRHDYVWDEETQCWEPNPIFDVMDS